MTQRTLDLHAAFAAPALRAPAAARVRCEVPRTLVRLDLGDHRGAAASALAAHDELAEQIARTRDAVARHFPAETRVTDPQGGFVLWLELPPVVDCTALHTRAVQEGIAFVPGEMFSAGGQYRNCLRLACGQPWNGTLEDGIKRLGRLAAGSDKSRRRRYGAVQGR